jgi:hypothetical protein
MTNHDARYEVALYLRGRDLDPNHVSSVLGIEPTLSQRKGERHITSTSKEFVTKIGVWAVVSQEEVPSLSNFIDKIGRELSGFGSSLNEISGVEEAYLDFFVSMSANENGGGELKFELDMECAELLHKLGVPVRFTVVFTRP